MTQRENSKNKRLNNDLDPDFDLDQYMEDEAKGLGSAATEEKEFLGDDTSKIKNSFLLLGIFTLAFLWYFNWSPREAYNYFFPPEVQTAQLDGFVVDVPPINIQFPEGFGEGINEAVEEGLAEALAELERLQVSPNTGTSLDMSFTDYMAEINDLGYLDDFGSSSLSSMYQNNVPVDYIAQFGQNGLLNDFGGSSITRFYTNNIPFTYIQSFDEAGLLNDLGSTSISQLYQNQVPFDYIMGFKTGGMMNDFGGTSITRLYQNDVPLSYIKGISDAGYLNNFGSTSISNLHSNNVPLSFLNKLNERGLLDNMSSRSIIDAFRIDGE